MTCLCLYAVAIRVILEIGKWKVIPEKFMMGLNSLGITRGDILKNEKALSNINISQEILISLPLGVEICGI